MQMKNSPILFSQEEITKFIEPIKSIGGRIDFFNFLLKIYEAAFNHSSDEDIIKYITKYNITTNAVEEKDLSSPSLSVLLIEVENGYRDFKYKSSKFINLQISISQLRIFVQYKFKELNTTYSIVNSNFELFFDIIPLIHKLSASKDHRKTLKWFEKYYSIILDISYLSDDFCYEKLFEKYNLELKDPYFKPSVIKGAGINSTKYSTFKKYLQFNLAPFVEKTLDALKFNVLIIEAKLKCPDKFKDDNDKFPVFDFHYEIIHRYCENVFSETEDKIDYFCHILKVYNRLVALKDIIPDNAHDSIPHIKTELKLLKLSFKMEKSKSGKKQIKTKTGKTNNKKSTYKLSTNKIINRDKLIWLGTKEQLLKLLRLLRKFEYIKNDLEKDQECENLLSHFVDEKNKPFARFKSAKKIRLNTVNADLYYLYRNIAFVEKKLLSTERIWKKTEKIFLNKDKGIMNNKKCAAAYYRLSDKDRNRLDDIIKSVYQ